MYDYVWVDANAGEYGILRMILAFTLDNVVKEINVKDFLRV